MLTIFPSDGLEVLPTVRTTLVRLEAELDAALDLLRGARDVEWVSDTACLFLIRIDHLVHMAGAVGSRIALAKDALRSLERAA